MDVPVGFPRERVAQLPQCDSECLRLERLPLQFRKPASDFLLAGGQDALDRGQHGFGLIAVDDSGLEVSPEAGSPRAT